MEELLVELLAQHESRRLDAVQWLREAIQAARTHERASAEALRAAFVEFVGRFDPAELEARFERTLRRSVKTAANDESRYWRLFVEFYRNLAEMPADRMPHTFVEAFATAYKRALQTKSETQ
ncbi:MAG: type VI secretion system-associated FHA domain protein [Steroidobacteraceae bacterium]